jgi:hypothetical protein
MKEEILFAGISLVFTCLLLLFRGLFLSRLKDRKSHFTVIRLDDDPGDSGRDDAADKKTASPLLVSPGLSTFISSAEEWPSEIAVPAEFFSRK